MLRSRFVRHGLAFVGLILSAALAHAEPAAQGVGVAIMDFAYVDTSGEPTDQAAAHQRRLQALMAALRRDFTTDKRFHLVPVSCSPAPCAGDGPTPSDLLRDAKDAGARFLVIGGIHKQSTLIQWAQVQAIDIAADRVVLNRLFTFRGDSDEAWDRAETFMSRETRSALATPDHP